ncbi:MAG: 50S ribosomal protein L5 [Alphaproteobacteria bacterium 40-19]|nr:MAG: 50S ribosomal protein L5 [Alphaproteobacteria bacterium 40-19]
MLSFKEHYEQVVIPSLKEEFKYGNVHQVPKLEKIVINMGMGRKLLDKSVVESAIDTLSRISGQHPSLTRFAQSNASFKVREGMLAGLKVTLRGRRMYEFLQRLIYIAMPRIRDFRGVSPKSFDGRGNFSMGLKEQTVFPEVPYEGITELWGMDINIVTTARTDPEAKVLLEKFGMPFRS